MSRIRLDIDQDTFEHLVEQRQLTAEHFSCVDCDDKCYLQQLFLRLLKKRLLGQGSANTSGSSQWH